MAGVRERFAAIDPPNEEFIHRPPATRNPREFSVHRWKKTRSTNATPYKDKVP
jgi:hypothetical protein